MIKLYCTYVCKFQRLNKNTHFSNLKTEPREMSQLINWPFKHEAMSLTPIP